MTINRIRNRSDRHSLFGYGLVGLATSLLELFTGGWYVTDWRREYLCLDEELITSCWEATRMAVLTIRGKEV